MNEQDAWDYMRNKSPGIFLLLNGLRLGSGFTTSELETCFLMAFQAGVCRGVEDLHAEINKLFEVGK